MGSWSSRKLVYCLDGEVGLCVGVNVSLSNNEVTDLGWKGFSSLEIGLFYSIWWYDVEGASLHKPLHLLYSHVHMFTSVNANMHAYEQMNVKTFIPCWCICALEGGFCIGLQVRVTFSFFKLMQKYVNTFRCQTTAFKMPDFQSQNSANISWCNLFFEG